MNYATWVNGQMEHLCYVYAPMKMRFQVMTSTTAKNGLGLESRVSSEMLEFR